MKVFTRQSFLLFSILAWQATNLLFAVDETAGFQRLTGTPAEDILGWDDASKFTAIPFEESLSFCGVADSGAGDVLTVLGAFWTVDQFVYDAVDQPRHYYAEVVTGTDTGNRFDIVGNSGNTLTVDVNGGSLAGIAPGDEIRVYAKWSLNLLFPDGGNLTPSTDSTVGTEILLPGGVPGSVDFSNVPTFHYRSDLSRWVNANDIATDAGDLLISRGALFVIKQSAGSPIRPIFAGASAASGVPLYATVSYQDLLPDIGVEQPVNTGLTDGTSTVDFGTVDVGVPVSVVFTIRNTGEAELTGITADVTGANASDFTTGAPGASSLEPGESTTVSVQFQPGATGSRTAVLQIGSNDTDEDPFDVTLTGSTPEGVALESWAGGFGLAGDELLPTADDDEDGVTLLEEYAFNLDPTANDRQFLTPGSGTSGLPFTSLVDDCLQIEFIRRTGDASLTVTSQFSSTLVSDDFAASPETEIVTTIDGNFERVVISDSETTATAARRFGRVVIVKTP